MITNLAGQLCQFRDFDRDFLLFSNDPADYIQQHWVAGVLYEREELDVIRRFVRDGAVCVDIGSNVGNHAVFMATVLKASKVYCFEPLEACSDVLQVNARLNRCSDVIDCSYLGLVLGSSVSTAYGITPPGNIGATRFVQDDCISPAAKPVIPLDSLNIDHFVDFVKIDVEGSEIDVLLGMKRLVRRCRPSMFVEVGNDNIDAFSLFLQESAYRIVYRNRRYSENENFLVAPVSDFTL